MGETVLEDRVLVDQVGQADNPFFLVRFLSRLLPLLGGQLFEAQPESGGLSKGEHLLQDHVPLFVQRPFFGLAQGVFPNT